MKALKKSIRIFITLTSIAFLFLFLIPIYIGNILNLGNIIGILICVILLFKFGFDDKYNQLKNKLLSNKITAILWRIYSICGIIFTAYAILVSCFMLVASQKAPEINSTVVVLGAKVNPNGPSVSLMGRINSAQKYMKNNPTSKAIVTGGQGLDEPISEAQCMYKYITEYGIDKERIYIEDKATDTYENLQFSYNIIQSNNLDDNLAITTDSYHQLRARIIAYKLGINSKIGAVNATNNSLIGITIYPTYFVREWFAIPVEILK